MTDWLPEHEKRLVALRARGKTYSQIATDLTLWFGVEFTKDAVQKRMQKLPAEETLADRPPAQPMPYFDKWFRPDGRAKVQPFKGEWTSPAYGPREILVLTDLHIASHDEALVTRALAEHSSADEVILGGDVMEIFAYSRFQKERNIPIERELDATVRLFEYLNAAYKRTRVIGGNHDYGRIKAAFGGVPPGLKFLLEENILRRLAEPFGNVEVVEDWWVQCGDAIIAHADHYRGGAPNTVLKVAEKLENFRLTGQLPLQPWRCLIQAHTHHVGSRIWRGRKLIESGTLAKLPLPYSVAATSIGYSEPQTNGYVVLVQRDGETLLNETHAVYLEGGSNGASDFLRAA